jgi:hypothetical protein
MKKAIFCFAAISLCIVSSFSQAPTKINVPAAPPALEGWQETTGWLNAFHTVFGKQADTQWVSWLAGQGRLYPDPATGGLYIVLPDYMYSYAKLRAKLDYGIFENENTRLMPIKHETARRDDTWYARFAGTLEGVPATLDMAVFLLDGKYRTVMGFYPGNELANGFSAKFRQDANRLLNSPAVVDR